MPDDKKKRGKPDRDRVAAQEPYEVKYFAQKHHITAVIAKKIIEKNGPSRDKCNKAAEKLTHQ